jgi:HlyD family secretion protein
MHPNPRRILPILVLIALAAVAVWYFTTNPGGQSDGALAASGTIESLQVRLAPELGGRVLQVLVEEGAAVKAGDVLVELDPALLQAQRDQAQAAYQLTQTGVSAAQSAVDSAQARLASAEAGLQAAEAALALLKSGPTADQVQAAREQVAQADANVQALNATLQNITQGVRPEDLHAAYQALKHAQAQYAGMRVVLTQDTLDKVHSAVEMAESNHQKAQERFDELEKFNLAPAPALEAARVTVTDTMTALAATQKISEAVLGDTPFYLQIETAKSNWEIIRDYQSKAQVRVNYILTVRDIPLQAINALDDSKDDANRLAEAASQVYSSIAFGQTAKQLEEAWNDVREAQRVLNNYSRLSFGPNTTSVETLMNQIDAVSAGKAAAQANLQNLQSGARQEQLDSAQAQVDAAKAGVDAARAGVEAAQAQSDAAQAQVEAAQAAINTFDVQILKLSIVSPIDGVVLTRAIEPGEMAAAGSTLLELGQLDRLTITVYLPEDRYGTVELGQKALVTVDSFPDLGFEASVVQIADRAEFTPRNVQTEEGRRTTVFAIKLAVVSPEGKLKPGMPADVEFVNND